MELSYTAYLKCDYITILCYWRLLQTQRCGIKQIKGMPNGGKNPCKRLLACILRIKAILY
jgi:hypothetical protein